MTVNGGLPDPGVSNVTTNNPGGGQPGATPPSKGPSPLQDKVVTTNAPGAYTSRQRPHT
ncbi:MAG TPA: hypothetical protein VFB23_04880 [Candidatus Acidoferrales bacterium]|jgi:hypothetical protein|nr:hypothetical protein [Candidatus Acidoferrales bacterium]